MNITETLKYLKENYSDIFKPFEEREKRYRSQHEYFEANRKQAIKNDTTYYQRKKKIYPKKEIIHKIWDYIINKNLAEVVEWAIIEGYYTLPRASWQAETEEEEKEIWLKYIDKVLRDLSRISGLDLIKRNDKKYDRYDEALKIMAKIKHKKTKENFSVYRTKYPGDYGRNYRDK